jgi:hypothetical protein
VQRKRTGALISASVKGEIASEEATGGEETLRAV